MLRLKKSFWQNLKNWLWELLFFFKTLFLYFQKKLTIFSFRFEQAKNLIVSLFVLKRGRYKRSFLHFGMMFFLGLGVLGAPILAETNPLLPQNETLIKSSTPSEVLSSISQGDVFQTQISPKPRDRVMTYTVEKGDTLLTIANKFGISTDTIRWANNLSSDSLTIGTELKIPPVTGMVHKVERGDSVYTIAKKYDTEAQKIVNFPFNDFANPETFSLVEGQMLIIPEGVKPKAPLRSPRPAPAFTPSQIAQSSAGFIWPASGNITQYPVWYHNALDIANKNAPDVLAAKSGIVTSTVCEKWSYGCNIILSHPDGLETLYAHLQSFYVSSGDSVSQGQAIGKMGSTGRSTGPHLHFEVRKNGAILNPLNFLK